MIRQWTIDAASDTRAEVTSTVNRLWAGNGAGLISALSLLAATARDGHPVPLWWFICPGAFVVGVGALGASNVLTIRRLTKRLHSLEGTNGLMDAKIDIFSSPSEAIGVLWSDCRALLSLLAVLSLVVGVVAGLLAVIVATRR